MDSEKEEFLIVLGEDREDFLKSSYIPECQRKGNFSDKWCKKSGLSGRGNKYLKMYIKFRDYK